ncbi:MAG: oligosaccharide flippase family protein [Metasolibacillus sp.]|uniref:Oligosaccharide flippase family protein n=1 Tax=Lysinibacillus louembei TaxID=1470088 RepID=A0ABZ0RTS9_9BACI|nr:MULTISPECIES: oligosaccharide flippase family protein [Bacillales]MCT6923085.1 oligosaccharide flippase family protein [Metasolibacillus sp.]MCT6939323.1 oligosaccharide flippase family protein [Metasolibacillus sp.]WPK10829.1 oligosaccharide flippase family protein [Lysinibacillus louembei]
MASFIKGTIFLIVVIFLSKCFGFLYRMQFMRVAGEEAVGIYMTAYPTFIFFISIAQLGLPIAVAKLTAELRAKKRDADVQAVMAKAIFISTIAIIILLPPLYFSLPWLARTLLQNEAIALTLKVSLLTVPIVVYASLIKAYLQGLAKITPTAWAQLLEQVLRIALVTLLLPYFVHTDASLTAAGAMLITLLGEIFSLLFLAFHYAKEKYSQKTNSYPAAPLFRIALPSAGSKMFGTFTWFLEPIIFLKALTVSGLAATAATTLYGVISGVHIPLLLFPSFIPNALAIVLIPAVSDAVARNNTAVLTERVAVSLRLSSIIGCFAATYFFIYGDELAMKLFHLEENRGFMKILAPIFYFYYVQSPLHSILQAVDEARAAMMNSVYGGLAKLFILFALASQPFIQEKGAIIAIGFGVLITSFLHIATLRQHPRIGVGYQIFVVPYGIFIVVATFQSFISLTGHFWIDNAITLLMVTFLLIIMRQIRWTDLRYLRAIFSRL